MVWRRLLLSYYWAKQYGRSLLAAGVMIAILLATIMMTAHENLALKAEQARLAQAIQLLQRQVRQYEDEINALRHQPGYIEYLLRHELGYGRKGERIMRKQSQSQ